MAKRAAEEDVTGEPTIDAWYRGRAVLVLGGLGFIGVNLSERLLAAGARVTVVTPRRGAHAQDSAALAPIVAGALEPGDAVLIKGSLGSRMKLVVNALTPRAEAA